MENCHLCIERDRKIRLQREEEIDVDYEKTVVFVTYLTICEEDESLLLTGETDPELFNPEQEEKQTVSKRVQYS